MPTPIKLLILEDRTEDAELMLAELLRADFAPDSQFVSTEKAFGEALHAELDVILARHSLPQFDGGRALRLLKERGLDIPLILVSGTIGEEAAVDLLKNGLADYVIKDRLGRLAPAVASALDAKRLRDASRKAEAALRLSETRFRALIEHGRDFVSILDADGRLLWESPSAARILGYKQDEYVGRSVFDLVHPHDLAVARSSLQDCLQRPDTPLTAEFRLQDTDGSWQWAEVMATNLLAEPSVNGIVLNYRYISDRKQAEEALRESEARYRGIFDGVDEAILVESTDGRILDANESACRMYGYSRAEFLTRRVSDIVEPGAAIPWEILQNQPRARPLERTNIRRNGEHFPVEVSGTLIELQGSTVMLAVIRDITERKQAEERLSSTEANYRNIFQNSPWGIFQSTPAGRFLSVNATMASLYGYDSPEQMLESVTDIATQIYADAERRRDWMTLVQARGVVKQFEAPMRRRDGSVFWVTTNGRVVKDDQGTILYYEGFVIDITERKQAEESLRLSQHKYATIFENALMAITQTTPDGRFVTGNPAAARMLGYDSVDDMLATAPNLDQRFYVQPGRRQDLMRLLQRDQIVMDFESEVYRKDGSTIWISEGSTAVRDADGAVMLHQGTFLDVTERRRALLNLQRQISRLAAVSEIDRAVASSLDLRLSLSVLLKQVLAQLEVDAACVLILDPITHSLNFSAGSGFRTEALQYTRLPLGQGYAGKAALKRETVHVQNLRGQNTDFLRSPAFAAEDFDAYWGVPLIAKGAVQGVLELFHRTSLERDADWLDFLQTLAGQAAIAIDNVSLFDGLQRSNNELRMAYDDAIQGWSNAMDLRDHETEGHTLRVTDMAVKLARAAGLDEPDLLQLRRGALLHDIGKMGVPDAILFKPGQLTDEEWVLMKKHPALAHEMLAPIRQLRGALDIPWCHHEKWDGSGYPRGLKGTEIPLAARIFAIVDVWDALTSDRPYRSAWSAKKAREYILDQAGSHFDPAMVKIGLESGLLDA